MSPKTMKMTVLVYIATTFIQDLSPEKTGCGAYNVRIGLTLLVPMCPKEIRNEKMDETFRYRLKLNNCMVGAEAGQLVAAQYVACLIYTRSNCLCVPKIVVSRLCVIPVDPKISAFKQRN
uniref:SFRICE_036944 n=1 Tax=Spodoptera frugiperda TaxID=7108 RepID=A0A2H1WLE5_SPOFR